MTPFTQVRKNKKKFFFDPLVQLVTTSCGFQMSLGSIPPSPFASTFALFIPSYFLPRLTGAPASAFSTFPAATRKIPCGYELGPDFLPTDGPPHTSFPLVTL